MSIFSDRLKQLMISKGVSGKWVAEKSSVSETNISRYASGKNNPSVVEFLPRIADALNTSVDYLVGYSDISVRTELTKEQSAILRSYNNLCDGDREIVDTILMREMSPEEKVLFTKPKEELKIG